MPSKIGNSYPGVQTRDEDWRHFFTTQIWRDIVYMLEQDAEYGLDLLLSDKIQDSNEINRLRGKIEAYREMTGLADNMAAIMQSDEDEETEEEEHDVD